MKGGICGVGCIALGYDKGFYFLSCSPFFALLCFVERKNA